MQPPQVLSATDDKRPSHCSWKLPMYLLGFECGLSEGLEPLL